MRTFHWLFLMTLTMFLGGVVIAQAPTTGSTQATAPPAPCEIVLPAAIKAAAPGKPPLSGMAAKAKVKDIMNSMIVPSSTVIFGSVATITDASGVHEYKPENDDQWNTVFANAVMLSEAANLLMVAGRQRCLGGAIPAVYRADFIQKARELVEAGTEALVAAQKHDVESISNAGERIDVACDQCHEKYQISAGDPENYKKVLGTYKLTAEEKAAGAAEKAAALKAAPPAAPKK
jgi:cytochrome c556